MRAGMFVGIMAAAVAFGACGGGQTVEPAPAVVAPAPPPPPPQEEIDVRVWFVFWDGIHVFTVYPRGGLIRSEEPGNSVPPFGEQSPHFSIISHYWEKESDFARVISEADSVERLLELLVREPLVEIVEDTNPVYEL